MFKTSRFSVQKEEHTYPFAQCIKCCELLIRSTRSQQENKVCDNRLRPSFGFSDAFLRNQIGWLRKNKHVIRREGYTQLEDRALHDVTFGFEKTLNPYMTNALPALMVGPDAAG